MHGIWEAMSAGRLKELRLCVACWRCMEKAFEVSIDHNLLPTPERGPKSAGDALLEEANHCTCLQYICH